MADYRQSKEDDRKEVREHFGGALGSRISRGHLCVAFYTRRTDVILVDQLTALREVAVSEKSQWLPHFGYSEVLASEQRKLERWLQSSSLKPLEYPVKAWIPLLHHKRATCEDLTASGQWLNGSRKVVFVSYSLDHR